jgi:hypothetical protein
MWNYWCRDYFSDQVMKCQDPFYRDYERHFRMAFFQDATGDDTILEPWITISAEVKGNVWREVWGVKEGHHDPAIEGGAFKMDPPLKSWDDVRQLKMFHHEVDEKATARNLAKLHDAIGDIVPINISRTPVYTNFMGDISTCLAGLRGLDTIMLDMYEHPRELHGLLTFMRDSILKNNQEAEDAGHYTLTSGHNQAMTYADPLPRPKPNSKPCKRKDLWGFCAAQEYTLVSPEFHDEFMFQYQLPIMAHYGLVHYGCCEDLTRKVGMLKKLKNLRSIAVTPVADIRRGAAAIGRDYIVSWRPNPTDMVCTEWNEDRIRTIITEGKDVFKDSFYHICLKDVETLRGEPDRLARWVRMVRAIVEK